MTVLLVDDEELVRLMLREILIGMGFNVLLAANGEEALQKLSASQVDLVIADVYMPVMDGRKLHRAVRENPSYQNLPFLFVSAYGDEYAKNAVKDPRYEGFYGKGESIDKLMSLIHSLTNPMKKAQKDGGED